MEVFSDNETEFDFRAVGDGRSAQARYANNSNYRNDSLIRKESESMLTRPRKDLSANTIDSVCQLYLDCRDQKDHQGKRDHEVGQITQCQS
jgi:hypothetical protein